jgi:hypothetical protein
MIVSAHLGHWYSVFGFLVPAVLVVMWIRYQTRRERRRQEFSQYWTMELKDGEWKLVEIEPAPGSRRQRRARLQLTPPPWSDPLEEGDAAGSAPAAADVGSALRSTTNGHSE